MYEERAPAAADPEVACPQIYIRRMERQLVHSIKKRSKQGEESALVDATRLREQRNAAYARARSSDAGAAKAQPEIVKLVLVLSTVDPLYAYSSPGHIRRGGGCFKPTWYV